MTGRVPSDRYPWWVKVTMLGGRTRRTMWVYFLASIVLGVVLVAVGVGLDRPFYLWLGMIGAPLSAVAYWLTIRWVDAHGDWPD